MLEMTERDRIRRIEKRRLMKLSKTQIRKIELDNNICITKNDTGGYLYNTDRNAVYGWQFVTPEMVARAG